MSWLPFGLALVACLATIVIVAVLERRDAACSCPVHQHERF